MSGPPKHPRTALVTGASTGLGAEYARQLAERGYSLVLVARRAEVLHELGGRLRDLHGVEVECLPADLATEADLARVEERVRAGGKDGSAPIDLLVNNAAIGGGGWFAGQDTETVERVLDLNVRAVVRLTHAVLPALVERREAGEDRVPLGVLNVSSLAGALPALPRGAMYAASKAFVRSFSESLAVEMRRHRVCVTVVLPGYVRTDMTRKLQESGVPGIVWTARERVVSESLRALALGRPSVVPGAQYKAAGGLLRLVPGRLVHGFLGRRG